MIAYRPHNIEFLRKTAKGNLAKQRNLLKTAIKSNLNAISEIALNLKNGNLPVHPKLRKKLSRYRSTVLKVANKRISSKKKKQLLLQQGGVLPLLATTFLSILAPIIGRSIVNSLNNV